MRYILASASPRRRELFAFVRESFEIRVPKVREQLPEGVKDAAAAEYLAALKGRAAAEQFGCADAVIVSADTIVCVEGEILGKPEDAEDARRMLEKLSGRMHKVYTGVAITGAAGERIFSVETAVEFYPLSEELISDYIATGEPFDKAGAYGIQGRGSILVRGIRGDYFNVMGLPVARLYRELEEFEARSGE